MSSTVRALLVAVEKYTDSGLSQLPGTIDRAFAFRRWLIGTKGADPSNILFCASPKPPEAGYEAVAREIDAAIVKLIDDGQDRTDELYVLFTGHGFELVDANEGWREDLLVDSLFEQKFGLENTIPVNLLMTYLLRALGPGTHYWFIDACRVPFDVPVDQPRIGLPKRPSRRGGATPNALFAAAEGAPARNCSQYMSVLVKSLRGDGRAKAWLREEPAGYWVKFDRVSEVLTQTLRDEGTDVQPLANAEPGRILRLEEVADVSVKLDVAGAVDGDEFTLILSGGERPPMRRTFRWPASALSVPPGDYWVELEHEDNVLRVVPPQDHPVDLYSDTELRFDKHTASAPPAQVSLERTAEPLEYRIIDRDSSALLKRTLGGEVSAPPGRYRVQLWEADELVGSSDIEVIGEESFELTTHDVVPLPPIEITRARHGAGRDWVRGVDLMGRRATDVRVLDPRLTVALSLLGGAAINDEQPYRDAVRHFDTLDNLRPGQSAVVVLAYPSTEGYCVVLGGGQQAQLSDLPNGAGGHATLVTKPGRMLLGLSLPGLTDSILASQAFANCGTLVVIAQHEGRVDVRQFSIPVGHLLQEMGDVGGIDVPAMLRFSELAQRRFSESRPIMAATDTEEHQRAWDQLVRGQWPDRLTATVAAYEMVRQGEAHRNPDALSTLLTRLTVEGPMDDVAILRALLDGDAPPTGVQPLVSDGLFASETVRLPIAGACLDVRGPWIRWHVGVRTAGPRS